MNKIKKSGSSLAWALFKKKYIKIVTIWKSITSKNNKVFNLFGDLKTGN